MFNPFSAIAFPASRFISQLQQTTLLANPWLSLTEIRFDVQQFYPALFAFYHIPQPAHLSQAVIKRRAEYLASRYAARVALASSGIVDFTLENDADRAPMWPRGIIGSLSHTAQRAVIISAADRPQRLAGVDVEQLMKADNALELSEMIVSASELHHLRQCGLPLTTALTLAFSLKESLYKALYPHLRQFMDFHSAEVTKLDGETGEACLRLTRSFSAEFPAGRQFSGYFQQQQDEIITLVADEIHPAGG